MHDKNNVVVGGTTGAYSLMCWQEHSFMCWNWLVIML